MVSKTSNIPTDSCVTKIEDSKAKCSQPTPLTGRQLLTKYLKNHLDAAVSYRKVCNALEILDRMEPQGRVQFIDQLLDTSDLLDARCGILVANLSNVPWQCIPEEAIGKYQQLLGEIAVRHVCHTETIYQSAIGYLYPKLALQDDVDHSADDKTDTRLFNVAHQLIAHILRCFPMSSKTLMSNLRRQFPHFSHKAVVYNSYIRNLMQIGEYAPQLFSEIWDLIIENTVIADSQLAYKAGADVSIIFRLDSDELDDSQSSDSDEYTKLDNFSADVFAYLSVKHDVHCDLDLKFIRLGNFVQSEDIFQCFLSILENRLLMSVNVRYTSFVWLYLCSLNKSYPERLLEFLWTVASRPQRTQSDTKKAHGAANYIAAFVARAKCIKINSAIVWMKRIFDWLVQYIDNISNVQTYAGGARHGLFYALSQAIFIIFSFRYKEMVKSGDMEDIRRWGVGRVVHSSLEPLRYVSRPVALCFGAISRSLQLVYVNHVLHRDLAGNMPFESSFPLDCYCLHSTEELIVPLMRRFSPLAEDVHSLTSVLRLDVKKDEDNDSGMDFLNDEDDFISDPSGSRPISISQQNSLFTVYSNSPGLRHFDSSMR